MLLMKESVLSLKEKQHKLDFPTFKLPANTNIVQDSPVKYLFFDDFSVRLLGFRIKFSFLNISQRPYCICILWL